MDDITGITQSYGWNSTRIWHCTLGKPAINKHCQSSCEQPRASNSGRPDSGIIQACLFGRNQYVPLQVVHMTHYATLSAYRDQTFELF